MLHVQGTYHGVVYEGKVHRIRENYATHGTWVYVDLDTPIQVHGTARTEIALSIPCDPSIATIFEVN